MSDTYVLAGSGTVVDFDRASLLMDRELLTAALRAREQHERTTSPRWDANDCAQWMWDEYCELHFEKYGEPFGPDVIPGWGQPASYPERPIDLGPTPERFVRVLGPDQTPPPYAGSRPPKA